MRSPYEKHPIDIGKEDLSIIARDIIEADFSNKATKWQIFYAIQARLPNADNIRLLQFLPYKLYQKLEKLLPSINNIPADDNGLIQISYSSDSIGLDQAGLIASIKWQDGYCFIANKAALLSLKRLFTSDYKRRAKHYDDIARLAMGLLYTYGVVRYDFFVSQLEKFIGRSINESELLSLLRINLGLDPLVRFFDMQLPNGKITRYITHIHDDYGALAVEIASFQHASRLSYRTFTKQQILSRGPVPNNKHSDKLKSTMLYINRHAAKMYGYEYNTNNYRFHLDFDRMLIWNELGADTLLEAFRLCNTKSAEDDDKLRKAWLIWDQNTPTYWTSGHSKISTQDKHGKDNHR